MFDVVLVGCDDGLMVFYECSVEFLLNLMFEFDVILIIELCGDGLILLVLVKLVIEILDIILVSDLGCKVVFYVMYVVFEYWVVDLEGCVVY